jgi:uncharacterized membrane protein YqaE (UPF0057 family)
MQHDIPIWFLVLSIFLPRVALFIGWLDHWWLPIPQPWAAIVWVFLPRIIVLTMIYSSQGFGTWFWIHLVAALLTWGSGSSQVARRS